MEDIKTDINNSNGINNHTLNVLCDYFRLELRMSKIGGIINPKQSLYLSGLRYKEIILKKNWWKGSLGCPLLVALKEGGYIAVLPCKMSGYYFYSLGNNKKIKINASNAKMLDDLACMLFLAFPAKRLKIKNTLPFLLNKRVMREIIIILTAGLIVGIIDIIPAMLSQQIFNMIIPENMRTMMIEIIIILMVFGIADIIFSIIMNLGISRISTIGVFSLQTAVWSRLLESEINLLDSYNVSDIMNKVKSLDNLKQLFGIDNVGAYVTVAFGFLNVILLLSYNVRITLYVLLMFAILIIICILANIKKAKLIFNYLESENKAEDFLRQCTDGIQRIRLSNAEQDFYDAWLEYEEKKRIIGKKITSVDNALNSFFIFFRSSTPALIYFLISQNFDFSVGVFIAYLSIFLLLQNNVIQFLRAVSTASSAISAYKNIAPILESLPEYDEKKEFPSDITASLEVNGVSFNYDSHSKTILKDISFSINEGENLAIIGDAGAGKSTLFKLLTGFLEPSKGEIYCGGYNLKNINLREYRKNCTIILQEKNILNASIADNITCMNDAIDESKIYDSIRFSGLREDIKNFPQEINTNATELSYEQRQRILVSRIYAKKSKFIFLDEPLLGLNLQEKNEFLKYICNLPASIIIFSRSPEIAKYCDKTIFLQP